MEPLVSITPINSIPLTQEEDIKAQEIADKLLKRFPFEEEFIRYSPFIIDEMPPRSFLQLNADDLAAIELVKNVAHVGSYCSRAFTRARHGDLVIGPHPPIPGYLEYMANRLDLGLARYIQVKPPGKMSSWEVFRTLCVDTAIQDLIIKEMAGREGLVIQPYLSISYAWELARILQERSRKPVKVLSPTPRVSSLANNKLKFLEMVKELLGSHYGINSRSVTQFDEIIHGVKEIIKNHEALLLRYPSSATGNASIRLESRKLKQMSSSEMSAYFREWLKKQEWEKKTVPLLLTGWEGKILASPSCQVWIPPEKLGLPIAEQVLDQFFLPEDPLVFVGSRLSQLPQELIEKIRKACTQVARVFQKLKYCGRCSFDLILCGNSLEEAQIKFVECNGRWGGGSTPLLLINRLFKDYRTQPYSHKKVLNDRLIGINFPRFLSLFDDILYDANTNHGWAIVYTLALLESNGALDLITLGETTDHAVQRQEEFIRLIKERT